VASLAGIRLTDFQTEIAEAYKRAALGSASMQSAVNALEAIRSALAGRRTGLRALDAVDAQIALAEDSGLVEVLATLRVELKQTIFEEQRRALEEFAEGDAAEATAEWLRAYAAAYAYGRMDVCANVCEADVKLDESLPARARFAQWTRLDGDERWAEALPMFTLFAEREELGADARARFVVDAAKVQMYHLLDLDRAEKLLRRAEAVDPTFPGLLVARGELANQRNDARTGEQLLREALDTSERYDACTMLGDAAKTAENYSAAEQWYNAAIAERPGKATAYLGLAWTYFGQGGLAQHSRIITMVERAALVEPDSAYTAYVQLGDIMDTGGDHDAAQTWFKKAISLAPERIRAYVTRGYCHGLGGRLVEGEQDFRTAIRLADESFDGHWGLAWLLEQAGRFDDAEASYRITLERRPSWRPTIVACIARMERLLGRIDEGERLAFEAFEHAPANEELLNELHLLVDELAEQRGERRRALAALDRIRAGRDESYDSNYHNRVGRIHYFYDDYALAADAFRRSLEVHPNDAVVWRNLTNAHRQLGEWDEADRDAARAFEFDGKEVEYALARALTLNMRANRLYDESRYEEACDLYTEASKFAPGDAVIHSNRANAAVEIYRPGQRREALVLARAALEKAIELEPDDSYLDRLAQLELEARLLDAVGEPQVVEGVRPRVIAIEFATDLLPLILLPGEQTLKPETLVLIDELRARMRASTGLLLPGLKLDEDTSLPEGCYALYFLEHPESLGSTIAAGSVFAGPATELQQHGIDGRPLTLPWPAKTVYALDAAAARAATAAGLEAWDPMEVPLRHLEHAVAEKLARTTNAPMRTADATAATRSTT
jgi:tetratricopeptide (TPR) repeat protein